MNHIVLFVIASALGMATQVAPAAAQGRLGGMDTLLVRMDSKRELIDVNNQWRAGRLGNNATLLGTLITDNFTYGLDGTTEAGTRFLDDVRSGERSYEFISDRETGFWIEGDSAIVTGLSISRGYLRDVFSTGSSQFTRVYVRRDGRWLMRSSSSRSMIQT
jgi:hypothetical protein